MKIESGTWEYGPDAESRRKVRFANPTFGSMLDAVKTVTLRALLRDPYKVKKITDTGRKVKITENGKPLWTIQSAKLVLESRR